MELAAFVNQRFARDWGSPSSHGASTAPSNRDLPSNDREILSDAWESADGRRTLSHDCTERGRVEEYSHTGLPVFHVGGRAPSGGAQRSNR
jgi:hypothetical protein